MVNLNNFNVQEMNAREIRETEGGVIGLAILFVASVSLGFAIGSRIWD